MNEPFRITDLTDEQWEQGQALLALAERHQRAKARRTHQIGNLLMAWFGLMLVFGLAALLLQQVPA